MNKQNKTEEFIGFYYMDDTALCDDLINLFDRSPKHEGTISRVGNKVVEPKTKLSTDVTIQNDKEPEVQAYLIHLQKCVDAYIGSFKYCNEYAPFRLSDKFNIQMYKPNEGYFEWHTERGSATPPDSTRHLVFMTYLNDVTDAGETEFYYQKLKVKPEKGLTLIWPADWTHTHRGITSPTQVKYIVTGWLNYV